MKTMSNPVPINKIPIQKIIESIEALSPEDQALLFEQLYKQRKHQQPRKTPELSLQIGNASCNILTAEDSNFWGEQGQAIYHVLIKNEADGTVSATLLGWNNCKAFGTTRSLAVQSLQDLVNAQLAEAEIVSVQLTSTQSDNPWLRLAGKYQHDSDYDEVLSYIEEYRRELDAENEEEEHRLDAEAQAK